MAREAPANPDWYRVMLWQEDPFRVVRPMLGPVPPRISGGYGGWQEIPRARRTPLLEYVGPTAVTLTIQLMFDGYAGRDSVEDNIKTLELMAMRGEDELAPPDIWVVGAYQPRYANTPWVINDIQWADEGMIRDKDLDATIRQSATVVCLKRPEVAALGKLSPAAVTRANTAARPIVYVVKRGDTLLTIAVKLLGDSKRWKEIKDLNGLRDPKNITPGQKLKIPKK